VGRVLGEVWLACRSERLCAAALAATAGQPKALTENHGIGVMVQPLGVCLVMLATVLHGSRGGGWLTVSNVAEATIVNDVLEIGTAAT
jgi:hypothetical protein